MRKIGIGLASAALLATAAPAFAQYNAAYGPVAPPQVQAVGPFDVFQDIVGGNVGLSQNAYASQALLSGYFAQGAQADNFLIGGDFGQNLWQRGTTGPGGTITYNANPPYTADRWFAWSSLASSTFTVNQVTTAAALPAGTADALQVKIANSVTGKGQMCVAQEIPANASNYLAGHTVELDFSTYPGATFTGATVNAYISYGTDSGGDNGSNNYAYALNAAGSGTTAWTGFANASVGAYTPTVSTLQKWAVVGNIPTTATEVAVALCFTPSGTSSGTGGTDYIDYSQVQLRKADHLAPFANAATAYAVTASGVNPAVGYITLPPVTSTVGTALVIQQPTQQGVIPAFTRRQQTLEQLLQYAFYYQWNDLTTAGLPIGPAGYYNTTTACQIQFPLPAPLYKAPTIVNSAITASTFTVAQSGGTPAAGAALAGTGNSGLILTVGSNTNAVSGSATNFAGVNLSFITAAKTQYAACQLLSTNVSTASFGVASEL